MIKKSVITITARKTGSEITGILERLRCEKRRFDNPLTGLEEATPTISVLFTGTANFKDALSRPGTGFSDRGVEMYVYPKGYGYRIKLVALRESAAKSFLSAYSLMSGGGLFSPYSFLGNRYFNMRHSEAYRDQIARKLLE